MRILHSTPLLFVLAASPAIAEEFANRPMGTLLAELASSDVSRRIQAGISLREKGDDARRALEHLVAPEICPPLTDGAPTGEQEARIRELVHALADESYDIREEATTALIEMGPIVAGEVGRAVESEDPEVRTRARLVMDAVAATFDDETRSKARLEAARVLAAVAAPESERVFRHLLSDPEIRMRRLGDVGLRMLAATWPTAADASAPGDTASAAFWETALAEPREPEAGPAVEIPGIPWARGAPSSSVPGESECHLRCSISGEIADLLGPDATLEFSQTARFQERFTDDGAILRSYESFAAKFGFSQALGGPEDSAPLPDLAGKTIRLPFERDAPATLEDGSPIPNDRGTREPGQILSSILPAGAYRPGESRPIERTASARFLGPLVQDAGEQVEVLDLHGRVVYLGLDEGGRMRFRVACSAVATVEEGSQKVWQRYWLAGGLSLDPSDGTLVSSVLVGPYHAEVGVGGTSEEMRVQLDGAYLARYARRSE